MHLPYMVIFFVNQYDKVLLGIKILERSFTKSHKLFPRKILQAIRSCTPPFLLPNQHNYYCTE